MVHAVDVTEQVQARRSVEVLADELETRVSQRTAELLHANEQLQGFTYSVAHDLRQQIRGISINASIVLADAGDSLDEQTKIDLNRMAKAAEQLSRLVDDLLGYAKLSRLDPTINQVDLTTLAREVKHHVLEDAHGDRIPDFRIQENLGGVGDPMMLRLVLENLFSNALKYSAKEHAPLIEFGKGEQGFFVRDNGIGFDMKFSHKLFEPFERLHRPDEFSGTGIGLANVRRIIEKHGGKVWAESSPGSGATFYFTLGEQSDRSEQSDPSADRS
jgi:light-regulated signal transduction histidine kinase (bacteriophytochrome)